MEFDIEQKWNGIFLWEPWSIRSWQNSFLLICTFSRIRFFIRCFVSSFWTIGITGRHIDSLYDSVQFHCMPKALDVSRSIEMVIAYKLRKCGSTGTLSSSKWGKFKRRKLTNFSRRLPRGLVLTSCTVCTIRQRYKKEVEVQNTKTLNIKTCPKNK